MNVDWVIPCRYVEVHDNLGSMIGAGIDTFWYGNWGGEFGGERDRTRWETYPDQPRYGINYFGMRNRIGILTESYSYAPYSSQTHAALATTFRRESRYRTRKRAAGTSVSQG